MGGVGYAHVSDVYVGLLGAHARAKEEKIINDIKPGEPVQLKRTTAGICFASGLNN